MFVRFYEYTVSPTDRNEQEIIVKRNVVYVNGKSCDDKEKVKKVIELCKDRFWDAFRLSKLENQNYKGGVQARLQMSRGFRLVDLIGNGTNAEVMDFYDKLKRDILAIVE